MQVNANSAVPACLAFFSWHTGRIVSTLVHTHYQHTVSILCSMFVVVLIAFLHVVQLSLVISCSIFCSLLILHKMCESEPAIFNNLSLSPLFYVQHQSFSKRARFNPLLHRSIYSFLSVCYLVLKLSPSTVRLYPIASLMQDSLLSDSISSPHGPPHLLQ